jgi:hypothetical protein
MRPAVRDGPAARTFTDLSTCARSAPQAHPDGAPERAAARLRDVRQGLQTEGSHGEGTDPRGPWRSSISRRAPALNLCNSNSPLIWCASPSLSRAPPAKHASSVHEKLRPCVCDVCGAAFRENYNLRSHKRSVHKMDV